MPDSKTSSGSRGSSGFTDDEKAAMKERAKEAKAASKKGSREEGEAVQRAKIEEMTGADREMAEQVRALVTRIAPELEPRTWYGMPAWYRDGKVLCFFQPASKFKARYATIGFSDLAQIDEGNLWPTSYGITRLGDAEKKKLAALIRQAVS